MAGENLTAFSDVWSLGMNPPDVELMGLSVFITDPAAIRADFPDGVTDVDVRFHFRSSAFVAGEEVGGDFWQDRSHWEFIIGEFFNSGLLYLRQVLAIAPFGHVWTVAELEGLPSQWFVVTTDNSGPFTPPETWPLQLLNDGATLYVTDALSLGQLGAGVDAFAFCQRLSTSDAIGAIAGHGGAFSWKIRHHPTVDFLNDNFAVGAVFDDSSFDLTTALVDFILVMHVDAKFSFNRILSESALNTMGLTWWLIHTTG
jgi:hypothetical protein